MIKDIKISLVFKEDNEEYLMFRTKTKKESGKNILITTISSNSKY